MSCLSTHGGAGWAPDSFQDAVGDMVCGLCGQVFEKRENGWFLRSAKTEIERVGRMVCGTERHDLIRNHDALFEALTKPDKTIQYEGNPFAGLPGAIPDLQGFPLLVMSQCLACGTTIARPHSEEARRRLGETMEETVERLSKENK